MKKEAVQWVTLQIVRYRKAKGAERDILRNRIYKLLQPYLLSCIRNYLRDRKQYESDVEVISISWDGFQKGLQTYKDGTDLIRHFQSCCIRFVRNSYRQMPKEVAFNEVEVDRLYHTCPDTTIDGLMLLQTFREHLPIEYREVLDDTLHDTTRNFRKGQRDVKLPETRYHEAKRCMQIMIEFLVRGN